MNLINILFFASASSGLSINVDLLSGPRLSPRQSDARNGYFDVPILQSADHYMYTINISVGTPPQELAVQFDTGSSELWVPAADNDVCVQDQCLNGSFTPRLSSSYLLLEKDTMNISYFSVGDYAAGDWAQDTVVFEDGSELDSFVFGVARTGPNPLGVMGVSAVLDSLVEQGNIGKRAFSMYLNDLDSTEGSFLAGGIDHAKYTGELVALPLQGDTTGEKTYNCDVTVTNITFTDETGATTQLSPDGLANPMSLDSGTPDVWLDQSTFTQLATGFGAVGNEFGFWVPCSFREGKGTLNIGLGGENGITVHVPMSEMFGYQGYDSSSFDDESGGCSFNFNPIPSTSGGMLGDSFLRSAYVAFDMDNQIAAVAKAAFNKLDSSSIAVMAASATAIPGATRTGTATAVYEYSDLKYTTPSALLAQTQDGVIQVAKPTLRVGAGSNANSSSSRFGFCWVSGLGMAFVAALFIW